MKTLTRDDFQYLDGYYSFKFNIKLKSHLEICLEPCFNGFDIAVYKNQELLEPKVCLNEVGYGDESIMLDAIMGKVSPRSNQTWANALQKANTFCSKYL